MRRTPISLLYTTVAGETVLALDVAPSLLTPVTRALTAHYPGVGVTGVNQPEEEQAVSLHSYLRLVPDIQSLRTTADFEDALQRILTEPASGILSAVADRHDGLKASVRFELKPVSIRRRRRAKRVATIAAGPLAGWFPALTDSLAMRANGPLFERLSVFPFWFFPKGEEYTNKKLDDHLYRTAIVLTVTAPKDQEKLARKRLATLQAAFAPFVSPGTVALRATKRKTSFLLSGAELATLWHPPVTTTKTPDMREAALPYLPAPVELQGKPKTQTQLFSGKNSQNKQSALSRTVKNGSGEKKHKLPLGLAAHGNKRALGIFAEDRLHQLVIGKSGMGKSTLLHTQIAHDVMNQGVGLVDPHGDLVDDVLQTIPKHRTNDIVILDPTNPSSPTINPLACSAPSQRALVAENNLAALSKVFGFDEQTAPRLLYILRFTLLALVGTEEGSYLSIRPMLTDKRFRKRIVEKVEDAEVRAFWIDEVGNWSERYEQEAMPAILNKTGQFTAHPELRRMFGDPQGTVDLRQLMDNGKIVLIKLSQGKMGEPAARFAGSVLMAGFQNAAMTRADQDKAERKPFYLYADEYASFVNSSFADTLAQARKYGLYLTAAQQIVSQVEESIMDAMFGNLATLVSFQVAQKDAEQLAAELACEASDLMRLPKYHAIVRTAVSGVPTRPFVVKTLPPPVAKPCHANPRTIQRVLVRRYGSTSLLKA